MDVVRRRSDLLESAALSAIAMATPSRPASAPRLLCYHEVNENEPRDRYSVTREQFEEHVQFVADQRSVSSSTGTASGLAFTFDDNLRSHYAIAMPTLLSAGMTGLFFVNPGLVAPDGDLTSEQLEAMVEAGMEVGVHNLVHTVASQMSMSEFSLAAQACATFCDALGQERRWAYPGGHLGSFTPEQDDLLDELGFWRYTTVEGDADQVREHLQSRYVVRSYTTVGQLRLMAQGKMRSVGAAKRVRFALQQGVGDRRR